MPKKVEINEKGLTGLNWDTGGYVHEEFLPDLAGRAAIKTYREMSENDPVIGSILFAINMLVRQVTWRVDENPDGKKEDAEFLHQCMLDMEHSWDDFVSEIFSMLVYGWSIFEVVYKLRNGRQKDWRQSSRYSDGKVGWRKFSLRSQDSLDHWVFDNYGDVKGMVQKPPPDYKEIAIPIEKMVLFRTSTYKNNPEGKSMLRSAYRPWFYKKRIEEIEGVGIERDLTGLPFAEVDAAILSADATDAEKLLLSSIQDIVKNVRMDKSAGVIWPKIMDENGNSLYDFRLLTSPGARSHDTGAIIQRYDQRIAQTALADFILLGHENVGSFALSSDKTDIFAVALGAWLDSVEEVLNRFAVVPLMELNGMDTENPPSIKHGDIEKPDITVLSQFIATLTGVGMPLFPDPNLESYLREVAGLPEPSEDAQQAFSERQQQDLMSLMGGGDLPGAANQSWSQNAQGGNGDQTTAEQVATGAQGGQAGAYQ